MPDVGQSGSGGRLPTVLALLCALVGLGRAAAQPPHLDSWTTATTAHFTVRSDAGPERTAEIADGLESFRAVFSRLAPEVELRSPVPTLIFAFRDADGHAPYKTVADRGGVRILGQFVSHRDGNFITLNADPRFLGSFGVVLHEYVHDLVQYNFPNVPRWFNEGLAEYYSTFAVEGSTAVIGRPVARHLRWLARNGDIGLDEVLSAPRRPGAQNEAQREGRFYAVSWGLVHYLLSSGGERSAQLAGFLAGGAEGGDAVAAFEQSFGVRAREMETALRRYLLESQIPVAAVPVDEVPAQARAAVSPSRPAELLIGLGDLLARVGRESAAERHFDLALDWSPGHPDARAGLGYLRDRQGRLAEAEVLFAEVMETGSDRALTHLLFGRHLLLVHQAGEGESGAARDPAGLVRAARDAFARATQLAPDFAEAEAMLGYVHLLGGLDPADGIPHLERARSLLPGRADLLFQLLQAYLRADRLEQAVALAEGPIRRVGPEELLLEAREEIERWTLVQAANRAFEAGDLEAGLELLDRAVSVTTSPVLRTELEDRLAEIQRVAEEGAPR